MANEANPDPLAEAIAFRKRIARIEAQHKRRRAKVEAKLAAVDAQSNAEIAEAFVALSDEAKGVLKASGSA